ncbi:HIT family protein [Priestia megaterium]|uniref:HIT family protein n=1 Tax=Priestia megaterium TaxID=1404 RepID=UPI0015D5069D|nr:HIT domain-containing protein [Priestia megaterium]
MKECIFCNIVNKKSSAHIIFQDEYVTSFLDINPITKGHTLLIPNKHIERLNLIKDHKLSSHLMDSLIQVSNMLVQSGICEDFSIVQDNGEQADQDVNHLHFHIIPRYIMDGVNLNLETNKIYSNKESLYNTWQEIQKSMN